MAAFDAALRKLAVHCSFGEVLQDTLRDRFVCGLRHDAIQRRLSPEKSLTYDKVLDIAKVMEAADKDTREFKRIDAVAQETWWWLLTKAEVPNFPTILLQVRPAQSRSNGVQI